MYIINVKKKKKDGAHPKCITRAADVCRQGPQSEGDLPTTDP